MKELIFRWLDTTAKKNWFRAIDKQIRRVEKAEWDLWTEKHVLKSLVDEYNKIYGTKLKPDGITSDSIDYKDDI